jgi:hypothetical protein
MILPTNGNLLPCPFCGGPARQSQGGEWFGTRCDGSTKCPAHLFGLMHRSRQDADNAWNRRATDGVKASDDQTKARHTPGD